MSKSISIFVDGAEAITKLISRIEPILSLNFREFVTDDGKRFFEARTPDSIITVNAHDFENDRDMNFKKYAYEIEFQAIRDERYDVHERQIRTYANDLFVRLKPVLKRDMMLVDDLQKKLAEYRTKPDK